jgi:hypothetical protein
LKEFLRFTTYDEAVDAVVVVKGVVVDVVEVDKEKADPKENAEVVFRASEAEDNAGFVSVVVVDGVDPSFNPVDEESVPSEKPVPLNGDDCAVVVEGRLPNPLNGVDGLETAVTVAGLDVVDGLETAGIVEIIGLVAAGLAVDDCVEELRFNAKVGGLAGELIEKALDAPPAEENENAFEVSLELETFPKVGAALLIVALPETVSSLRPALGNLKVKLGVSDFESSFVTFCGSLTGATTGVTTLFAIGIEKVAETATFVFSLESA